MVEFIEFPDFFRYLTLYSAICNHSQPQKVMCQVFISTCQKQHTEKNGFYNSNQYNVWKCLQNESNNLMMSNNQGNTCQTASIIKSLVNEDKELDAIAFCMRPSQFSHSLFPEIELISQPPQSLLITPEPRIIVIAHLQSLVITAAVVVGYS